MKLLRRIIPLLLISTLLGGCQKKSSSDEPKEPSVKLSYTSITISEDKTFQLEATVDDALKGKMLFWTMRDEDIATVDNGLVTAIKEGSTICTVQCGSSSAKCAINVTAFEPEDALHIHLNKNSFNLNVNDEYVLPISISFGKQVVTNYTLTGESDDQSIAKLVNGAITALAVGSTDIILTAQYESYVCQDVITINVF